MKRFNDYETVQAAQEFERLPAGGYVVKIKEAEVRTYSGESGDFEKLEIALDICEGEYKDFYARDYQMQTGEDKKWRGVLRQYVPKDDGSEKDGWTKRAFKGLIVAIEESNPSYHWDWNEKGLKGKTVGCLFRNEEWEWDGRTGLKTAPFKFIEAQKIRDKKFTVPKDKLLKKSETNEFSSYTAGNDFKPIEDDDDLPF